jgi:energy-coupling factor transporter transmembrane protein EcfT
MQWIIIVAVLVILVFLASKYRGVKHKLGFVVLLVFLLLFLLSFWSAFHKSEIDFKSFGGIVEAGKVYFNWVFGIFGNTKSIAAYAIKQNWSSGFDNAAKLVNITGVSGAT